MSSSEEDTHVGEGESSAAPAYAPQGDQTQRFLTALGRFQRLIDRAQAGRPQGEWGEECMRQLVDALEIAIAQGWKDVVRTLTETARVLQSYLAADEAARCVPFLAEVYEILCLMVGDLIVGNVRSGVLDKWRARYGRAVADLEAAGIPLWTDEDETLGAATTASAPEPESETETQPEPEPEPAEPAPQLDWNPAEAEPKRPATASAPTPEWAKTDDLEPFPFDLEENVFPGPESSDAAPAFAADDDAATETGTGTETAEDAPDAVFDAFDPAEAPSPGVLTTDDFDVDLDEEVSLETPSEAEPPAETEAPGWEAMLPGVAAEPGPEGVWEASASEEPDDAAGEPVEEEGDSPDEDEADEETPAQGDEDAARPVLPHAVEQELDRFCERLERLAGEPPETLQAGWSELAGMLRSLEEFAQEHGRDGALAPCMAMGRMVRLASARRIVPDRRFTDLAFWFSGVYAEAGKRVSTPAIQGWLAECDDLLLSWATDAPSSAPEAVSAEKSATPAETVGDGDAGANPLWALLKTAQEAIAGGDPTNAKTLALQAAAQIAEMQAKEAEAKVAQAERRLTDGTAECDGMRSAVRDAEQAVAAAEQAAAQERSELEATQTRIAETRDELASLDASIERIEERIRALEAERDEALERKRVAGERLEDAEGQAAEGAEAVASREAEEQAARAALEDARQRVTLLERRRVENETAMERARELLNRRRSALQEIEETIAQIRDADGDATDGGEGDQRDDLLF